MSQIVKYKANDGVEVQLSPATVQAYIATGNAQADTRDVVRFIMTCKARGLNPLAGDAYMTVFNGKFGKTVSTVVSKDYFTRTARQQASCEGWKAGVALMDADGALIYREGTIIQRSKETLVGGWAEVYVDGCRVPFRAEVSLEEYDTGKSLWKSKPATMIRKVALVQALREAFPAMYGGIYDRDEIPSDLPEAPEAAQEPTPEPAVEVQAETQEPTESADAYDDGEDF